MIYLSGSRARLPWRKLRLSRGSMLEILAVRDFAVVCESRGTEPSAPAIWYARAPWNRMRRSRVRLQPNAGGRVVETPRVTLRVYAEWFVLIIMADELLHVLAIGELEEAENEVLRIPRVLRFRKNPFELEDKKFVRLYRLNKQLTADLIDSLRGFVRESPRSSALTLETKVFTTLRFYAGGPYQSFVGQDEYTTMDQSTVSRCITEVTHAINAHLMDRWVTFNLSLQSMASLRQRFFEKYGLPGTIGAIDCTHVAIIAPPVDHPVYRERDYFNHKRYHSINVQLICDADMKILNINARYPGATHDAYIYANSVIRQSLQETYGNNHTTNWLIGDSGYPLEPWLLTPVAGNIAHNSPEERYNTSLCSARSIIEQCNGLLKSRFRCLSKHRVLHYMPEKASKIINACVVLHNMCLSVNDAALVEDLGPIEEPDLANDHNEEHIPNQRAGRLVRERVIRQYFS